ncbi:MAG: YhfC family glutamic-type intramembrane protease [Myxococcaceae bacterium]
MRVEPVDALDPRLIASFMTAIALDVLMPVVLVFLLRRRLKVRWAVFGIGALAFAVSQIFTRVPLVAALQWALHGKMEFPGGAVIWVSFLAISAGLFEETARYVCFRKPLRNEQNWRTAVALGAGHGGIESAVLVGGLAAIGLVNAIVLSQLDPSTLPNLTPEALAQVTKAKETIANLRWWEPLLGAWERVGSIALHIALSVIVLQRFIRGSMAWYWLAVALHAGGNAAVVVVMKYWGTVAAEGFMTLVLALAVWIIFRLRPSNLANAPG